MVEELSISPRVKYYGCELEALVFKKKKKETRRIYGASNFKLKRM